MRLRRGGHTVVELLIALAIGAIVIGLGATIGFRHQRFHRDIVVAVERTEQLEQIAALIPIALRSIAPGEGDIAPGAARDTSLEFRATIASGVACDSGSTTVVLAPAGIAPRLASVLARPERGDTVWVLEAVDATERWAPRAIVAVFDSVTACAIGRSFPFGITPRRSLALRLAAALPGEATAIRVTRPWRYSLYRASDGAWYLGAKEWNPALARFNTIQPVAGPLVSAAASGLRFRFTDSNGVDLPSATSETKRIAAIEVALRADSVIPGKYAHAVGFKARSSVVIALRNRAR
jgi:hypothetical protein